MATGNGRRKTKSPNPPKSKSKEERSQPAPPGYDVTEYLLIGPARSIRDLLHLSQEEKKLLLGGAIGTKEYHEIRKAGETQAVLVTQMIKLTHLDILRPVRRRRRFHTLDDLANGQRFGQRGQVIPDAETSQE